MHCYRGKSRSATVVTAYLMYRHSYSMEKALGKVRAKRPCVNPHASFVAQLKLYENMDFTIDPRNIQLKMFRLHCASERMRKAKILFLDTSLMFSLFAQFACLCDGAVGMGAISYFLFSSPAVGGIINLL